MIDLLVHVFRSPQIKTATHLVVMLAIARRCGDEHGVCFAKQTTLAKDTRLHPKTVARAISDLVGEGLVKRFPQGVDDSQRRLPDHLYICLEAVVLPAIGPPKGGSALSKPGSPVSKSHGVLCPKAMESTTPYKRPLEETNRRVDAGEPAIGLEEPSGDQDSSEDDDLADLVLPVKMIWQAFSQSGRNRSSVKDTELALRAALRRRPEGVDVEGRLKAIMEGLRAYLATDDARKQQGAFQKGVHRMIEKDRWSSFVTETEAEREAALADHGLGTLEAPTEKAMRFWADLARQGLPWDPARGPRPGMPGCRISPAIQREFGFEPYADGPLDVALAKPLALPAPDLSAAPAAPDADDDASAFM